MASIDNQIVLSIVTVIVSVLVTTIVSSYVKKGEKVDVRVDTLWDLHNEKKKDSDKIDALIKNFNDMKDSNTSLDSHVRHSIANMQVSVNGFGSRLSNIESEAKNRDLAGSELKGKVDFLEKYILEKM